MNKLKMPFLWVIFTAVVFFSCGDAVDPDIGLYNIPENDCDLRNIEFVKIYTYYNDWYWFSRTSPYKVRMNYAEDINDCKIGDTIALECCLYDNMGTYWYNLPESVIVRVTTSRNDISFIKLFDDPHRGYEDSWPPPARRYYSHIIILNNKYYRDGDILTVEIKDKNKILKTTLNIRSK